MATISANGAHELARFSKINRADLGGRVSAWRTVLVMTSDGRLLQKIGDQSGYSVIARVKKHSPAIDDTDSLIRIATAWATARGYSVGVLAMPRDMAVLS